MPDPTAALPEQPDDDGRPLVRRFWPSVAQQEAVTARGCTCVETRPATHLEPPEWEQDPFCPQHPVIAIVLGTLDNALSALPAASVPQPERPTHIRLTRDIAGWSEGAVVEVEGWLGGQPGVPTGPFSPREKHALLTRSSDWEPAVPPAPEPEPCPDPECRDGWIWVDVGGDLGQIRQRCSSPAHRAPAPQPADEDVAEKLLNLFGFTMRPPPAVPHSEAVRNVSTTEDFARNELRVTLPAAAPQEEERPSPEPIPFSAGDRVRWVEGTTCGEVVGLRVAKHFTVRVRWDDDATSWCKPSDLEPVVPPVTRPERFLDRLERGEPLADHNHAEPPVTQPEPDPFERCGDCGTTWGAHDEFGCRPAAAPVTRQRGEEPGAVELFPGAQLTVAAPVTQQEPPPTMALADLIANHPPGSHPEPWTWDDEEDDILARLCLCCGEPGHYQRELEAHIAANGLNEAVCIYPDGKIDGHHRIVAARRLGIDQIPLESPDAAGERYLRDHGPVSWEIRSRGDVAPGHEAPLHRELWRLRAAQSSLECNGLCVFGDGEDAGPDPNCPRHGAASSSASQPAPSRHALAKVVYEHERQEHWQDWEAIPKGHHDLDRFYAVADAVIAAFDRAGAAGASQPAHPEQAVIAAARDAVAELDAVHRQADDGIGCVDCYPSDGRWPCASALIAADLRAALAGVEVEP